jgi:two-component system, sensor histidine kinase LadS
MMYDVVLPCSQIECRSDTPTSHLVHPTSHIIHQILVLLGLLGTLAGQAQPILRLDDPAITRRLWREPATEYYEDSSRYLTLAQVRTRAFRPARQHPPSFGFSNSTIWVRLRLQNHTPPPTSYVIGATFTLIDTLDYYLIDEATGHTTHQMAGRLIPHTRQAIDTDDRVFPLDVPVVGPATEPRTYTVYFRAVGRSAKLMRFFIGETNRYQAFYQKLTWLYALYLGFGGAMLLVQVVFFLLTRNRNSLYYLLYLAAFLLVEVCRGNGLVGDRYLWPQAAWFKAHSLLLTVPLSVWLGMWFYANGLQLRRYAPGLYRAFGVAAVGVLVVTVGSWWQADAINVVQQMLLLSVVSNVLVLAASAWVWRRGYRPARFYLMATLSLLVGMLLALLAQMGFLASLWWLSMMINVGAMLEMLFFTVALADEYRLGQQEQVRTQAELIGVLQTRNAEISSALLQGQTLERERVAADLHDTLGTTLSSLRWTLHSIRTKQLSTDEQAVIRQIDEQLTRAHADVRLLSHNLLPAELATEGLPTALQVLVDKLNQHTDTHFTLGLPDPPPRFGPQVEFELYSICLELTNNILKHAKATEALIRLRVQNDTLTLTLSDDGTGFGQTGERGKGLQNVAARVAVLGGTWTTDSEAGQGVTHRIVMPLLS